MATPRRFERPTYALGKRRSILLSYEVTATLEYVKKVIKTRFNYVRLPSKDQKTSKIRHLSAIPGHSFYPLTREPVSSYLPAGLNRPINCLIKWLVSRKG